MSGGQNLEWFRSAADAGIQPGETSWDECWIADARLEERKP